MEGSGTALGAAATVMRYQPRTKIRAGANSQVLPAVNCVKLPSNLKPECVHTVYHRAYSTGSLLQLSISMT
jgi:hypothetical protein